MSDYDAMPADPNVFVEECKTAWNLLYETAITNKFRSCVFAAASMKAAVEIYFSTGLTHEQFKAICENCWQLAAQTIKDAYDKSKCTPR